MSDKPVVLNELAKELNRDSSNFRKMVVEMGDVEMFQIRPAGKGNQQMNAVSAEDAEKIRRILKERGFLNPTKAVTKEVGHFYVVQPDPEARPNRLKLGFTESLNSRMTQHRGMAPELKVLRTWPCKRKWEFAVIDALASVGGSSISTEVFEFSDVEAVLERADELFALLADPAAKIPVFKEP